MQEERKSELSAFRHNSRNSTSEGRLQSEFQPFFKLTFNDGYYCGKPIQDFFHGLTSCLRNEIVKIRAEESMNYLELVPAEVKEQTLFLELSLSSSSKTLKNSTLKFYLPFKTCKE